MSIFRRLATKKAAEFVEIAAEQAKPHMEVIKTAATNKTGIFANLLKGAVCLVIGWLIVKEGSQDRAEKETKPSHIVINNYIYKEETKNDQKSEQNYER